MSARLGPPAAIKFSDLAPASAAEGNGAREAGVARQKRTAAAITAAASVFSRLDRADSHSGEEEDESRVRYLSNSVCSLVSTFAQIQEVRRIRIKSAERSSAFDRLDGEDGASGAAAKRVRLRTSPPPPPAQEVNRAPAQPGTVVRLSSGGGGRPRMASF